jgi:hypothetical protein
MIDKLIEEALSIIESTAEFDGRDTVEDALVISAEVLEEIIGPYLNKTELQNLLDSVVITENKYPNPPTIKPYEFCPRCGCSWTSSTGNMTQYPEHYEQWFCLRCGFLVAMVDNCPSTHALEWKENDYKIGF